jgi:hypothetical protein
MNSSLQTANLNRISASMLYYDNIIYLSVGVPLNMVNALVFTRLILNKSNKTNMGFLGLCQSIIDIIVLLYFSLVFRSTAFFGVNFSNTNDSLCKLTNYIRRFLTTTSSWMEVITTFDRFIFVIFGHGGRFKFMEKKRYLAIIIASVMLFLSIVHINNLFYFISKGSCTADSSILMASDMILICLRTYIPSLFMIIFNTFMIRIVIKKSRAALNESSKNRKQYLFTVSVIANDAFFLILDFPFTIYFIFYDINLYSGAINGDALFAAYYNFYGTISKDLAFYVQTLTFFVYLAFNKLYRNELLTLIGKVIPIKSNARVNPTNHTITLQGTA